MRKVLITILLIIIGIEQINAQERTVQNRPYTDLRQLHFGVLVGANFQDLKFLNAGNITYIDEDGIEQQSLVTMDQDNWEPGFTVGVLAEARINTSFQFRIAPSMYFGSHHLTFLNHTQKDEKGKNIIRHQEMKTAYIGVPMDIIFAAERFNNHRPYVMAGIEPAINLNTSNEQEIKLKKTEVFLEVGLGCDFYLPYFKLRPELKFMYGLTNSYDSNHAGEVKDKSMLPYTLSAKEAHTKILALTFYFE